MCKIEHKLDIMENSIYPYTKDQRNNHYYSSQNLDCNFYASLNMIELVDRFEPLALLNHFSSVLIGFHSLLTQLHTNKTQQKTRQALLCFLLRMY